jgi:Phage tail lysozyme
MAVKSVIEIDVLDEKFKAFSAAFDKYQKTLKDMPKDWQKVNAESAKATEKLNKNLQTAVKNQKEFNKSLGDANLNFKNVAKTTGDIARNLASGALSITKWLALGALGGGFGLGGLAAAASNVRRTATGFGITTGQLRGSRVALQRFIDPDAVLSNIADIQADLSRRQILTRLGGQAGQNPAQMLEQVMRNAVAQFRAGGKTKQYAEAMGLTEIFTLEDLRRMSANEKEFNKVLARLNDDIKQLETPDELGEKWQDFTTALSKSGNLLEKSLINNLVTLTPQLTKFSDSISHALDAFLSSDEVKQKLENFAKYLDSDEFKQAARDFIEGIKDLAQAVITVVSAIPQTMRGLQIIGNKLFGTESSQNITAVGATAPNKIVAGLMQLGVTNPEAIAGFMGGIYGESRFNPSASNQLGGGHYGIAQWGKTRQADFERLFGKPIQQSTIDEQVRFMQYELQNKESGTLRQLLAAKTREEGVRANLGFERYDTNMTDAQRKAELDRRLTYANQIRVDVTSTAGSDITANAKALPR